MTNWYLYPIYWMARFIIWLRYRIEVVGLDEIAKGKKEGILFLPNHTALIDPVIVLLVLWPQFRPRPLALEEFYLQLRWLLDLVRVVRIPSMDTPNKWKEQQIEKAKKTIAMRLGEGDNFLIYPSGHLKLQAEEHIGGASLVHDLLQIRPENTIVLVRTTGLWGSSFSCAPSKTTPDLKKTLLKEARAILKNGIFFTPRRDVKIELEFASADLPRKGEKMQINKWLEDWYNKNGPEPVKYVSLLFWKKELPEIKEDKKEKVAPVATSEEKRSEILNYLAKVTKRPAADLNPNLHLSNDLGLDSLEIGQLNVYLEDHFDIGPLAQGQLQTINDVLEASEGKVVGETPLGNKSKWPEEGSRPAPQIPEGKTIQEVFLNGCDRMKGAIACADAITGALSYKKLKLAAIILSFKIKEMPGENIGILLPSSVGAYITILATLLAGKVPVMLNWTTGFRNLEYAAELCEIKTILSSYLFLSRANTVDLGKTTDLLVLLEEVRHSISLKDKLKGLFSTPHLNTKEDDPAVIIFTSGTETMPKGVPLSHRNLLSNQRAALERVGVNSNDVFFGVLPPFHSFGFSITGLLPLLAGIKACYAPDPTKSRSMAKDIEEWKATIFCCAPSFIRALLHVAKEGQLKSLRLVVSGAEKAPQELFDTLQAQGKSVLEGYGISECSPVVTTDIEGKPHKGVGQPISHVELCIINPDDGSLLPQGQEGEVCISGPGVFNGYLGENKDPFITLQGKRWYRSGDRGHLDTDGTLILTGRLTRFVKIGGEMVSLGGVEEDILKICKEKGWLKDKPDQVQLALAVKDRAGEKPQIVLFVISEVNRDEINRALKELGHGSIVKITEVRKVDQIPLTGTGKVQYRILDETLQH